MTEIVSNRLDQVRTAGQGEGFMPTQEQRGAGETVLELRGHLLASGTIVGSGRADEDSRLGAASLASMSGARRSKQ